MKKLTAFLFGLTLAISVGVLAQDSVIPSRMKLQALRVGTGAIPAAGNITATGTIAGANVTANGLSVCRSDGTNCPAGTPVVVVVNRITSNQGLFSGSTDPIIWNNDIHDPNNLHDPAVNPSRILLPQGTGYAQCQASATLFRGTTTTNTNYFWEIYIQLNGNSSNGSWGQSKTYWYSGGSTSGDFLTVNVTSAVIPTSVATDYIEVKTADNWTNTPTGPNILTDGANSASQTRASCWAVGR